MKLNTQSITESSTELPINVVGGVPILESSGAIKKDLFLGKSAAGSTLQYAAEGAIGHTALTDGDPETVTADQNECRPGTRVAIDCVEPVSILFLEIFLSAIYGLTNSAICQFCWSDDGETWTDVQEFTLQAGLGQPAQLFSFPYSGEHRHWGFRVTDAPGGNIWLNGVAGGNEIREGSGDLRPVLPLRFLPMDAIIAAVRAALAS